MSPAPANRLLRCLVTGLLLVAAAAPASARPLYGWVQFHFPAFTSLHDCRDIDGNDTDSRQLCREFLQERRQLQAETFGDHPFMFLRAGLLHCNEGICEPLKSMPIGPPEHTWQDPGVENHGDHLLYHMPSELHGAKHVLQIHGLEHDWQSDRFSTPFRHNYFNVRFDTLHPGRMFLERDWAHTIADRENSARLLADARDMLAIWATLVLVAGIFAGLLGLIRQRSWGLAGRAWVMHAATLLLLMAVTYLPPWSNAVAMLALPVLYVASLPLDAWFIRRGLLRRNPQTTWREALLPAAVLRVGTLVAVGTGLGVMSRL